MWVPGFAVLPAELAARVGCLEQQPTWALLHHSPLSCKRPHPKLTSRLRTPPNRARPAASKGPYKPNLPLMRAFVSSSSKHRPDLHIKHAVPVRCPRVDCGQIVTFADGHAFAGPRVVPATGQSHAPSVGLVIGVGHLTSSMPGLSPPPSHENLSAHWAHHDCPRPWGSSD